MSFISDLENIVLNLYKPGKAAAPCSPWQASQPAEEGARQHRAETPHWSMCANEPACCTVLVVTPILPVLAGLLPALEVHSKPHFCGSSWVWVPTRWLLYTSGVNMQPSLLRSYFQKSVKGINLTFLPQSFCFQGSKVLELGSDYGTVRPILLTLYGSWIRWVVFSLTRGCRRPGGSPRKGAVWESEEILLYACKYSCVWAGYFTAGLYWGECGEPGMALRGRVTQHHASARQCSRAPTDMCRRRIKVFTAITWYGTQLTCGFSVQLKLRPRKTSILYHAVLHRI